MVWVWSRITTTSETEEKKALIRKNRKGGVTRREKEEVERNELTETHSKHLQGDSRWVLPSCSACSGWCGPARCWPLPIPVLQIILTAPVSVCMYLYIQPTSFSSLCYWSWMQVCRAGGDAALKGRQLFPTSASVVPRTQQHRDSRKHRQGKCLTGPCSSGVGTSAFQVLSGCCAVLLTLPQAGGIQHSSLLIEKTQTICPVSEGPRDSQRCVEQPPCSSSNVQLLHIGFCWSPGLVSELWSSRCHFMYPHP